MPGATPPQSAEGAAEDGCGIGLALLDADQPVAALAHFAALLQAHPDSETVRVAAATALVAPAVLALATAPSGEPLPDDPGSPWAGLAAALLQPNRCPVRPPALARIAAEQRGRPDAPTAHVARLLGPVLARIDQEHGLGRDGVLLLLVLRDHPLPGWAGERITDLHLRTFKDFDFRDLALPYSVLFGGTAGPLNRADIARYVAADPDGFRESGAVALAHLVFVEWLLGGGVFDSAAGWVQAIERRLPAAPADAATLAAAKSAVARHRLRPAFQHRLRSTAAALVDDTNDDTTDDTLGDPTPAGRVRSTAVAPAENAAPERDRARFDSRRWQAVTALRNDVVARAPFLSLLRRRLRVAVCVSGQLRGYEAALASWRRVFLRTMAPTLFVHSWRLLGRSGAHPSRYVLPFEGAAFTKAYREACQPANFDEFRDRYPALFRLLTESDTLRPETVARAYRTDQVVLDDESDDAFRGLSNPQKMHLKIAACHQMAVESGQGFDLVVRIRPDKPVLLQGFDWHALARQCRRKTLLFADHPFGIHYGLLGMGDQFAVGGPEAAAVFAGAWTRYPRLAAAGLLNCPPEFQGHFSLAQVCWAGGLEVRKIPMRFGALADARPIGTAQIVAALREDSAGRMDAVDRRLLDAARIDAG